ncbi:unnamed protein product [Ectocarpus sp. 13 AM-2016]
MSVGFAESFLSAFAFSALSILRMLAPSSGTLILPTGTDVLPLVSAVDANSLRHKRNQARLFQVVRRGKSRQGRPKLEAFYRTDPPVFSPPRALSPSQRSPQPHLHHHHAALRPPSRPRFSPPP